MFMGRKPIHLVYRNRKKEKRKGGRKGVGEEWREGGRREKGKRKREKDIGSQYSL
jgi:hypothetical protein